MSDLQTSPKPEGARARSKAESRARLMDAAAEAIFRHGIRGTTIGEIQSISGLSRGMINLHFASKENLLLAVACELTQRYDAHMDKVIAEAGRDPSDQLRAVFAADLDPQVLNARDVAIWFSFRSEMHSNPAFRSQISTRSGGFASRLGGICQALVEQGQSPDLATHALMAMLEGLWTDFHLNPDEFERDKALRTCLYTAEHLFPGRFS